MALAFTCATAIRHSSSVTFKVDPFDFHGRGDEALDEKITDSLVEVLLESQKEDPRLKLLNYFPDDIEQKKKQEKRNHFKCNR